MPVKVKKKRHWKTETFSLLSSRGGLEWPEGELMKTAEAYRWLLDYSKETALYESMKRLLGWDQRTFLPKGGHSHRAQQIAAITALFYRRATDPAFGEMLAKVEASRIPGGPLSDEAVNLREWRRNYDRANKIPEALAVELAKAASEGELAWQSMRRENDWKGFLPYLKRIISLKRQEATALSTEGEEIYNALIEEFRTGGKRKQYSGSLRRAWRRNHQIARKNRGQSLESRISPLCGESRPYPCRRVSSVKRLLGWATISRPAG